MFAKRGVAVILLLFSFLVLIPASLHAGDEWVPVPKDELAMKDYPNAPGVHALILLHKVDRNDREGWERQYYRIKIFDEEGKKYANVETDSYPGGYHVKDLKARTIRPDGTVVEFQGKPFEKIVAKYKGFSVKAKTFSIPDVQVGSIIEYKYVLTWDNSYVHDSQWTVQEPLVTREGQFNLTIAELGDGLNISWNVHLLPKEYQPKNEKNTVKLTLNNIPAFEKEEFMPPEDEIRARVEFIYSDKKFDATMDDYWKRESKEWTSKAEEFMDKKKAAEREVGSLTTTADSPDAKLRKLYDRVQALRNLTYERAKSEKEEAREKLKDNNNIEDVLKHGYAYHNQLIRTFVALARAAGFPATILRVQERDRGFLHKELRRFDLLDTELAVVTVNGKEMYLDPGVPFCPFGLLSWEDTGIPGLLLNKEGAQWSKSPSPRPEDSLRKRIASFTLDADGTLTGEVKVVFQGLDALNRRMSARNDDEAARKKELEDLFKGWMPATANIELGKIDDFTKSSDRFEVTYKVTLPGMAAATGKRILLPFSIFAGSDNNPFQHVKRIHPVYFRSPYEEIDEIKITLPEGMKVETLPAGKLIPTEFAEMQWKTQADEHSISLTRDVRMHGNFFRTEHYPALRGFLDQVKGVTDEQAILRNAPAK